jgi:hypothetical protein
MPWENQREIAGSIAAGSFHQIENDERSAALLDCLKNWGVLQG